jgi:multidrug efflux pump subunit AcrB
LIAALQAQNAVSPSGSLQTGDEKLLLQVSGAFRSEQDILAVNFLSNGRLIRLRDIAQVRRSYADPPQPMFRVNGQPAIGLAIAMSEGGDILALGRNIKAEIHDAIADLPLGIEPTLVSDQPAVVRTAIGEFMTSLWQAIAIIMAVSFVTLGIRAGAIVALSIPLTMAIIFPIMEWLGIDLQRISLGALIIALGLLVDDAMTTIDVMTSRLAQGDSKEHAATFAYQTLAFPMLTGSLVTAAGFVPIGFARSAAGEYTFSIFAVVTIALIVSWFVAVLFAPLLGVVLLAKPGGTAEPGVVVRIFRSLLVGAMRMRWLTIVATVACFVIALLALPYVPRQFFPASDRPELVVDLALPQNASIYATDQAASRLDALLKGDPDVARWSTYVGRGAIRFYLPLDVQLPRDSLAQAVVVAKDVAARKRLQSKLEQSLAEQMPGVVARISPLELGPPVGWPVQYRVQGPDIAQVRSIALRVAQVLGGNGQVKDVNFDWIEPSRKVRISIDQDQARLLGLSSRALAEVLNAVMTGTPITQVRDNIYLVDVIARAQDEQRISLSTLQGLQLPLPNGRTVPLSQVASFDFVQEYPLVWRRQRVPTLTVQADVASGTTPEAAVQALAPEIATLSKDLPKGYRIDVGGTVEESAQSQASVFDKVPLMLLLMVVFLMAQLHSFSRLALVLSVVPMGLIGIVIALLVFGQPLGFVAILGILALFGMIARNAVILIEQIETERAQRPQIWDAVVEATLSRFRPIMLTAISTVLGFIPIAPTVFWGPMAFAIMGGLFVATILTLIVLPALYVAWFRVKEPSHEMLAA